MTNLIAFLTLWLPLLIMFFPQKSAPISKPTIVNVHNHWPNVATLAVIFFVAYFIGTVVGGGS